MRHYEDHLHYTTEDLLAIAAETPEEEYVRQQERKAALRKLPLRASWNPLGITQGPGPWTDADQANDDRIWGRRDA